MDMHNAKRRPYASPTTSLIQVETESAICGGSVDVANPDENFGRINDQQVNGEFESDFSTGEWSNPTTGQ